MSVRHDALAVEDLDDDQVTAWAALCARSTPGNVFHGPDVLVPALRLLAGEGVRLVVVRDDDGWRLVVPVRSRTTFYRHPVPAAETLEHRQMPFGSPLVDPAAGPEHWDALLHGVGRLGSSWWVARLMAADHAEQLEAAAARRGLASRRVLTHERAMTHRHGAPDYLETSVPGKERRELRRHRRRLDEELPGGVEIVDLLAPGDRPADPADAAGAAGAAETFLRLEASGWKAPDGGAMALDPAEADFFRRSVAALHDRGDLEAWVLRSVDDQVVLAAAYLAYAADTMFWWKLAYDEAYARHAPGVLVAAHTLEAFHRRGAGTLDSCTVEGHALAATLNDDTRTLTTLLVGLGPRRGDLAVRSVVRWFHFRLAMNRRLGRS